MFGAHGCEVCLECMSAMMCYVVLLSLSILMDARVCLEWMSAMMCYVVLLSRLVLMNVRIRLE